MTTRQATLLEVFHPEFGNAGLYTEAFMRFVEVEGVSYWINKKDLEQRVISLREQRDHNYVDPGLDNHIGDIIKTKSGHAFDRPSNDEVKKHRTQFPELVDLACILRELNEHFFQSLEELKRKKYFSDFADIIDNDHELYEQLDSLFANSNGTVPRSAEHVLDDTIDTVAQASMWLTMHSQSIEQACVQLRASLAPTCYNHRHGDITSPIEVLGYGDNGDIGSFLDRFYPSSMDGEQIVLSARNAKAAILNPKFVKAWFDRDLDIGGCPALTHRRRMMAAGREDIYIGFMKLWTDSLEKYVAKRHAIKQQAEYDASLSTPKNP